MIAELVMTCVAAAIALAVLFCCCLRVTRSVLFAALILLPLALKIPWTKRFPAFGDAVTLIAVALVLAAWLRARRGTPLGRWKAFLVLACAVVVKPEILLLALGPLAVEYWSRRKHTPLSLALKGVALLFIAAAASIVAKKFVLPPSAALAGLYQRISNGAAWDTQTWMFAGGGARRLYRLAMTYSPHFWWPLAPPAAVLALGRRDEWWIVPTAAWATIICVLTLLQVPRSSFHGCLPMQSALIISFGLVAAGEFRRGKQPSPARKGPAPGEPDPLSPRAPGMLP
ncbi:MAG: hypothetical protein ACYTAN_12845 [Planctomycetota bacterium]|jgi:hypothetical protein